MSSWSTSAYPPRPRSRSRSPYRSGYLPPRAEGGYPPPDPYRMDWEHDKDRAWAQYERDRTGYDYPRRGRSRSPPPDEGGRKRRRSVSPWERDRYDPRPRYGDDYDAHSRGYGYTSPHRGPHPSQYPSRRAPPDPHTFDYPASLKQYAEWFRYFYPQQAAEEDSADKAAEQEAGDGSKPRNGIRSRWEKYKKDFATQQLHRMFEHHRKSPWFAEKYDPSPEYLQLRARVRKVAWKGRIDSFVLDLEAGKFDPDLSQPEPEADSSKEAGTNGDSAPPTSDTAVGDSAMAPSEETKPNVGGSGDDDMQFNVEQEDDGVDQDAGRNELNGSGKQPSDQNDSKRSIGRGEEVAIPPEGNQIMIRTIPPDIGRVKLEEVCTKLPGYMYLALGDPLQKRNYYRAGWIRFTDDVDMSATVADLSEKKIEGFKLHVSHITKPFTSRTRYAPEVASRPDRMAKDLDNAKKLAAILEQDYEDLRKRMFKEVEVNVNNVALPTIGATAEPPGPSTEEEGLDPEPRESGSEAVERRVEKVMADLRDNGELDFGDEKVVEERRTVIALDLYLAYLRSAFNTCYYCAVVTDHVEELQRKCVKHVRKPLSEALLQEIKAAEAEKIEPKVEGDKEKESNPRDKTDNRDWKRNDERWLEWLDSKIALLINRSGVDPAEYSGKSYDEELSKECEPHIKQEDEGKFRCKTCQKLFKATSFVEKHIANKHPDLVKHLEDVPYFNNFALDPHRIQPFTHPPQPAGNSNQAPPQAFGLPPAMMNEFTRPNAYFPPHPGYPPPPYSNGFWDPYAYPPHMGGPYPPPRRDEGVAGRRLSDRISGYAPGYEQPSEMPAIPASAGLPAKPIGAPLSDDSSKRGGFTGRVKTTTGPPPPPPNAKEDPRAAAGKKVSYHDMDLVAEGDVELMY